MYAGERVVALIPARGGSKSVRLKNLYPLGKKPLIQWTIDVAKESRAIDRVIVSTDHPKIAQCATHLGAEVAHRPAELSTDTALIVDVIRHHISELRANGESARWMVLLEPTSPFRLPMDIEDCLALLARGSFDSVATFEEARLNPYRAWRVDDDGTPHTFIDAAVPWLPRQKLPAAYQLNGAVYGFQIDRLPADTSGVLFGRSGAVIIESGRSIDIDNIFDFAVANAFLDNGFITLS